MSQIFVTALVLMVLWILGRRWFWLTPVALGLTLVSFGISIEQSYRTLRLDPSAPVRNKGAYRFEFGGVYSLEVQRHKKDGHKIAFATLCNDSPQVMSGSEFELINPTGLKVPLTKKFSLEPGACQKFQWPLGLQPDGRFQMSLVDQALLWDEDTRPTPKEWHWRWDRAVAENVASLLLMFGILVLFARSALRRSGAWIWSQVRYWVPVQEKTQNLNVPVEGSARGRGTDRDQRLSALREAIREETKRNR
jgi:hypothetical protein